MQKLSLAMDAGGNCDENDSIDWNTDDELEINGISPNFSSVSSAPEVIKSNGQACSSSSSWSSKMICHFMGMGFSERMVIKAIEENGKDEASILDSLLTNSVLESSPHKNQHVSPKRSPSNSATNFADDLSDNDSFPDIKETTNQSLERDTVLSLLVDMGYSYEEAFMALDKCGLDAHITELTDFICAVQMEKELDDRLRSEPPDEDDLTFHSHPRPRNDYFSYKKKRKLHQDESWKTRRGTEREKKPKFEEEMIHLPNPMIGFGIPDKPGRIVQRTLPEAAAGPPYFYYENVAFTPKGVWSKISRFLYEIEPEFVDSLYFCAAARKRGYIHNLPVHNRTRLLPKPPSTIQEALPATRKWWPSWDMRTKFNCLLTCIGSAKLTDRIKKELEKCDGEPPLDVQKNVLEQCKKWNLVWVGRNKVAPLEPDEMEMLLGFPRYHTRGGGTNRTDRYKALGNSFQVDTVAYHLSVLKNKFRNGINVLSLFSGIGGAEVALDRLQIPLKNVVSVEISKVNRNIFRCWWENTNQQGTLIEIHDVQEVTGHMLEQWISLFGSIDLVIGGSPCNNLAGGNRVSREGLEGQQSSLFFEYSRILDLVKCIVGSS